MSSHSTKSQDGTPGSSAPDGLHTQMPPDAPATAPATPVPAETESAPAA